MDRPSRIPSFPDDITYYILLELPMKSLLRFKSSCKSWCSSIDDPRFIKLHQHKSSTDISRQKLLFIDFIETQPSNYSPTILSTEASFTADSKVVLLDQHNIPGFCHEKSHNCTYFIRVHSCDGLIFIYHPGNMILWNPAIQKYKLIPLPDTLQQPNTSICTRIGFSYDSVADDYKVLCVQMERHSSYIVQIYSVKNQTWRRIDDIPVPPDFGLIIHDPVSLNGTIHIMATSLFDHFNPERLVISFSLGDENYTVTPVPSSSNFGSSIQFRAFANRVCIIKFKYVQGMYSWSKFGEEMSIWSLEKDEKTGLLTWNYFMKIPTLGSVIGKLDYYSGDLIYVGQHGYILWKKHDGPFIEYDMQKNKMLNEIYSFGGRLPLVYVESLLPFKLLWD